MNARDIALTGLDLRPLVASLPEYNEDALKPIMERAVARMTSSGEGAVVEKIEKAMAAGQPGLLDQLRPNFITEESLVRTFAAGFGLITLQGDTDQQPEFTLLEQDDVKINTVAVSKGRGGSRTRNQYRVVESQTTGFWKEIETDPVEIPWANPFFQRKRAILDLMASDKMAYFMAKELDKIAFTSVTSALKTTFAAADKVYTFRDADVSGVPAGNDATSAVGFWPTLRTKVIPFFQGVRKANRVINIHFMHTDLQYIFGVAPLGSTLGGYSEFQKQVYAGNITDIAIYGHRFRLIPENWQVTTGQLYCNVGPVFQMWLPPSGSVAHRLDRPDGSTVMSLHRIYEVLSPTVWWTNVYRTTFNTADVSG